MTTAVNAATAMTQAATERLRRGRRAAGGGRVVPLPPGAPMYAGSPVCGDQLELLDSNAGMG